MKKVAYKVLLLFLMFVSGNYINAQITSFGIPHFKPSIDTFKVPEIIFNLKNYLNEKTSADKNLLKNNDFAVALEVSISPETDGIWKILPDKQKKIWLLKIKVDQAISLNLVLEPFQLNEGTKLFFYDSLQSRIIGAITYRNNKPYNILPLSEIKGNIVYCEMQVPDYLADYGDFTISIIGAEPAKQTSLLKDTEDMYFNNSQPCNYNIACVKDRNISNQKNAVCRIIYSGSGRCTGTLLNNLANDGKPYIITAAHCINTQYVANSAVFYFGYESPDCINADGPINSLSGATLISAGNHIYDANDTLDFALLLLDDAIPLEYLPYYSGWDVTGTTPDSVYVIHHPWGDVKKISFDSNRPETGSAGYRFDLNTHWLVQEYEIGTTENGSSGASLIDNHNRAIGILTLGGDACSVIINDYYQKFSHCYNDYSNPTYQLKQWLDPKNTSKLICNGYDAAGIYRNQAGKLRNYVPFSETHTTLQTIGWGNSTGHNYQGNTYFAEKFFINGSKYLYGANIEPSVAYTKNAERKIIFTIWEGENEPQKKIYSKSIALSEIDEGNPYYIDFDSTILVSGSFFAGYEIFYNSDTFAMALHKSIQSENTAYTYLKSWKPLQFDNSNQYGHLGIELLTFDLMPEKGVQPDTANWYDISIYPNPIKDQLQIFFKNPVNGRVDCKIYDFSGRLVFQQYYTYPEQNIPIFPNLAAGDYLLQVILNSERPICFNLIVSP